MKKYIAALKQFISGSPYNTLLLKVIIGEKEYKERVAEWPCREKYDVISTVFAQPAFQLAMSLQSASDLK